MRGGRPAGDDVEPGNAATIGDERAAAASRESCAGLLRPTARGHFFLDIDVGQTVVFDWMVGFDGPIEWID